MPSTVKKALDESWNPKKARSDMQGLAKSYDKLVPYNIHNLNEDFIKQAKEMDSSRVDNISEFTKNIRQLKPDVQKETKSGELVKMSEWKRFGPIGKALRAAKK